MNKVQRENPDGWSGPPRRARGANEHMTKVRDLRAPHPYGTSPGRETVPVRIPYGYPVRDAASDTGMSQRPITWVSLRNMQRVLFILDRTLDDHDGITTVNDDEV